MRFQKIFPSCVKAVFMGGSLLIAACAMAQSPQADGSTATSSTRKVVPLVSDSCPVVHVGDAISLDWNPVFDPASEVSGLRAMSLTFGGVRQNGVFINERPLFSLGREQGAASVSPIGNGYYHIEIPLTSRQINPGVYHLVGAQAVAAVFPEYQGEAPRMTLSPVRERFCITVVGASTDGSSSSGG